VVCAEFRFKTGRSDLRDPSTVQYVGDVNSLIECGIDDRVSRLSCRVSKYDCTWRTKYERDGFAANNPSKWFLCVLLFVSHADSVF
jgi:hypothetical protein